MKYPLSHRKIGALDGLCLRAIAWYQRRISPRKGYRCAHARLHGGAGCSGFARAAITQLGWRAAIPRVRARFAACKLAAQTLRAQSASDGTNSGAGKSKERGWSDHFGDACCVDFSWVCCADSLLDSSACADASCADASCAHGACADTSCAEAACGCHSCF